VRDLLAVGMYVILLSVPHLDTIRTLTLLHDLVERREGIRETVDRDNAAPTGERGISDLTARVAANTRVSPRSTHNALTAPRIAS
jgi:hypothetical protein